MGRPGRCHAWGCGDHSVPPSSLSCGEAWVWRGRCWQARGGTNWAVWTHPKRVRGWGRWGRETREAESGVKLFAAAAPGGSGPLPALLFLPAGQRAATVLSQLAASLSTWTRCDGSTRSRSGRFQPAHSPSAPDSPVLSCCNTPTAFYAPWTSSPCALPTPKGLETCGGRGGGGAGRDPRGVSGQAKGEVASGALSAGVAPPSCSPVVGVFCLNAGPGGCWRGVAGQGLGGSPRGWPEDHSKLPSREGTGWGSWWSRPSRPAVLYPGPGSGRSRRWDPTNSVGDHERGWPPAGGLRAGARGDSSRGLVLRRTVLCRTPLHGCLLSSEARILRLQGAS